jgi:hypothetical protein
VKHVLAAALALVLAQGAARPDARLPPETAGWDNVITTLLSVFDRADVLALGEAHGRKVDAELRLRLVRDPRFAARVRSIVVEISSAEIERLSSTSTPAYGGLIEILRGLAQPVQVITNQLPTSAEDRNAPAIAAIRDHVSKGEKYWSCTGQATCGIVKAASRQCSIVSRRAARS